jgi:hypothetical protein
MQASLEHTQSNHLMRELLEQVLDLEGEAMGLRTGPSELLSDSLSDQSVVLIGDSQSTRGRPIANVGHRSVVELVLLLSGQLEFNVENLGILKEGIRVHRGTVPFERFLVKVVVTCR